MIQSIIPGTVKPGAAMVNSATTASGTPDIGKQFADILKDTLNQIGAEEQQVDQMNRLFAAGQMQDVHQLLLASEKASLNLQLTVQIRNKMIEAYQEIMRTQV